MRLIRLLSGENDSEHRRTTLLVLAYLGLRLRDCVFLSVGPKLSLCIPREASQWLCRLPLSLPRDNCSGFAEEIRVID